MRKNGNIVTVYGWQLGDEGKGKITSQFRDADYVAVATGWWNAGHTVELDNGTKLAFHELPGWAIIENAKVYIGQWRVIHLHNLEKEIQTLEENNLNHDGKIIIAGNAHVVLDAGMFMDDFIEKTKKKPVGTTRKAIGPTYANKWLRTGVTINMLLHMSDQELQDIADINKAVRPEGAAQNMFENLKSNQQQLQKLIAQYGIQIDESNMLLNKAAHEGKKILVEHSQSALLAIDGWFYPNCTSSDTSINGIYSWLNLPESHTNVAVMKLIKSKVWNGHFPTKQTGSDIDIYRQASGEFGATTGRPRDLGFFDAVEARKVLRTNHTDILAFTKADMLHMLKEQKIGERYIDENGNEYTYEIPPFYKKVSVQYSRNFNLQQKIEGIQDKESLPKEYRQYFDYLIETLDFNGNVIIGTGPSRKDFIIYQ